MAQRNQSLNYKGFYNSIFNKIISEINIRHFDILKITLGDLELYKF